MFKFNPAKLDGKEIGHGEFGIVHPYRKSNDDKRWVVKCIEVKTIEEISEFMQSVVVGYNQNHSNILSVAGYQIIEENGVGKIYIKMPRVMDNLKAKIHRHGIQGRNSISLEDIIAHFYDSVKGLEYLEHKKIAHHDLKPSNILINEKGEALLCDIGMKRGKNLTYVAPELIHSKRVSKKMNFMKGDVWSLGIIVIELCLLELQPMKTSNVDELRKNIHKNLEEVSHIYGKELAHILSKMVEVDPEKRISFKELRRTLESQYAGLDREKPEEEVKEEKAEGRQTFGEQSTSDKEKESEQINLHGIKPRTSSFSWQARRKFEAIDSLEKAKTELQEKWEEFFKFEIGEQWSITTRNKSKITDIEVDIFLFDVSEKLKEQDHHQIKQLTLDFSGCTQLSNTTMVHIAKHIADHFTNVLDLKLDLGGCDQITDTGMKQLVNLISQQLIGLQHLTLDFSYWVKTTDAGMNQISTYLAHLKDLSYLRLNFSYTNVTDVGVAQLVNEIANSLPKLEYLILYLGGCMRLTDTGLTQIGNHLGRQLPDLKYLALDFSYCVTMTDIGVIHFANIVPKHLRKLEHLAIDFGGCSDISDKGVTALATQIAQHLKTLQRLILDFQGCIRVTGKPKELLRHTLNFIPYIDIK